MRAQRDELVRAIQAISEDPARFKEACMKRAKEFDTEIFLKKMRMIIAAK